MSPTTPLGCDTVCAMSIEQLESLSAGLITNAADESLPIEAMAAGVYTVCLINQSNLEIDVARVQYPGKPAGPWFAVPHTPRNCFNSNPDICLKNGNYTPLFTVACNLPVAVTLCTKPDDDGNMKGAVWNINPNCAQYSGGCVVLV